jgi:hypothetical protein
MWRTARLATVAVLMLVGSDAAAQGTPTDSVTGSAENCLALRPPDPDLPGPECGHGISLATNAFSGAAGEDASGTVRFREHFGSPSTDFITEAAVTCLSITGKVAIIGVTGRTQFLGAEAGLIRVSDGGSGQDEDTYQFASITNFGDPALPGPTTCATFSGRVSRPDPARHQRTGRPQGQRRIGCADHKEPVQTRRVAELQRLQESGRLRQLRATEGKNQPSGP